jgi:endonuclease/exonuclease/phosphatase (EEP) superfamily protein YafD
MKQQATARVAPRSSMVRRFARAAVFALPWTLVALLCWSERPYWLDLASHFLLHAAVACLVIGALMAAVRWRWFGLNFLAVGIAVALGWRLSMSVPDARAAGPDERVVRLLEYNARGEHSRHDNDAVAWIRDQNADLIVLIEPPWGLLSDYPFLKEAYPYRVEPEAGLMWEVIVLSRHPAEIRAIAEYSEKTKFSFAARRSLIVRVPGCEPFLLSAMHPPSPRTRETWRRGIDTIELNGKIIEAWRRASAMEVVIAGDFNSSPVGRYHRLFRSTSGLTGWSPMFAAGTWPALLPRWLSVPIDRVWTSAGVRVRSITIGPRFRSDHRGVVAELIVPAGPERTPSPSGPDEPAGTDAR